MDEGSSIDNTSSFPNSTLLEWSPSVCFSNPASTTFFKYQSIGMVASWLVSTSQFGTGLSYEDLAKKDAELQMRIAQLCMDLGVTQRNKSLSLSSIPLLIIFTWKKTCYTHPVRILPHLWILHKSLKIYLPVSQKKTIHKKTCHLCGLQDSIPAWVN